MTVKIVIIGGGSYLWSPVLIRDIIVHPSLKEGGEIWLVDINTEAIKEIKTYANVLNNIIKSNFVFYGTTERDKALTGTDFIILSISTGGLDAMRYDLEIPEKYGIYQTVGDTVGPGGISRNLRNVPVFTEIAKSIKRFCPQAWVLNLTNPLTVLTKVLADQGCLAIGLCHEHFGVWGLFKEHFKCKLDEISMKIAGLNHFGFVLDAAYKGESIIHLFDEWAKSTDKKMQKNLNLADEVQTEPIFRYYYYRETGRMLYPSDIHCAEFFPNFITRETNYGMLYGMRLKKMAVRYKNLKDRRNRLYKWIDKPETIPLESSLESSVDIIAALRESYTITNVVNVPNEGQIDNIPRGTVVETMATIGNNRVIPHAIGKLPDDLAMLLAPHAYRFNLVLEAALTGSRQVALQAILNEPLMHDCRVAGKILDELLNANRQYLPQFF